MQVVVDIPEELTKKGRWYTDEEMWVVIKATQNGTPLPKGHGDLIDRNSILCDDLPCNLCGHTDECFKLLAPTIIEADSEE